MTRLPPGHFEGKTIAWIDEEPSDPDYGGEARGTLLIHFTDGTALKIELLRGPGPAREGSP